VGPKKKSQLEPREVFLYGLVRICRIGQRRELIRPSGKATIEIKKRCKTRGEQRGSFRKKSRLLRMTLFMVLLKELVEVDLRERTMTV